jgi:hypothetical protein
MARKPWEATLVHQDPKCILDTILRVILNGGRCDVNTQRIRREDLRSILGIPVSDRGVPIDIEDATLRLGCGARRCRSSADSPEFVCAYRSKRHRIANLSARCNLEACQ